MGQRLTPVPFKGLLFVKLLGVYPFLFIKYEFQEAGDETLYIEMERQRSLNPVGVAVGSGIKCGVGRRRSPWDQSNRRQFCLRSMKS